VTDTSENPQPAASDAATPRYDRDYFEHYGGTPYRRDEPWLTFFAHIADMIVADIGPTTVLDVGCGMGLLVEALRDRGVEAYGLDVSEYAIANVRDDIRAYCWQASATDPFPRRYDLIVCIEVLEHLEPSEALKAIENICAATDDVIFSSTAVDFAEETHVNVQPTEYWAQQFARRGFLRDVDFDGSIITAWTARFRKSQESLTRVVTMYERRHWQLANENNQVRQKLIELRNQLADVRARLEEAERQRAETAAELAHTQAQFQQHREESRIALQQAEAALDALLNTRTYRYTAPARRLYGWLRTEPPAIDEP
jgi:SAM-dependent methyltransferase